ncbi:hypothetical protein MFLAVUS_006231 [Mucor flavus]|uniref:Ras-GEF domain-containing protein n=1 Tax=Mucor flavus TaxID=439312 RepID=A0ABP9Z0Z9_9FUNG
MFRKFMKPLDLVNILIQRFELDLIKNNDTSLIIPTIRQERIRSFFCLWLSQYWGDFKSSATRRIVIQFLERICRFESLSCIGDVLLPLAMREAAIYDKDIWGMSDEEEQQQKQDIQQQQQQQQQRKKDSGYSDSFGAWAQHEKSIKKRPTIKARLLSSSLRRATSTNSHQRLPVSFKSIISLATHDNNRRNSTPPVSSSTCNTGLSYCPAIFGGGLISIQHQTLNDPFETITCFSPAQFAEQFTCIEAELFRKIQPRDFLRHLWIQKKKQHHNKNPVLASIEHFNFISAWISSLVVNQPLLERRVILFEICLQIAVELKRLNNFNTLMAVLAGVNNAAVLRLKRTRELTRVKNKALYEDFLALELLMSSERSFSNYRSTLKQTELPGIPYLGIHQQDLVSLGEANKDHKMDGKVHWDKFRLMGESILEMMRFQYPTYHLLESNPFLLYFIGHQTVSTEDELYEKSKEIEPRQNMSSLSTKIKMSNTKCLAYPITNVPLIDDIVLPLTPNPSDDEEDIKPMKLVRRGTVSLADLIPVASAALKAKHRLSIQQQQQNNAPSTQDSPLARALTKVRIGVQTHRIKERYLTNEWVRLALQVPVDDSTINSPLRIKNMNRTKGIVAWYEYKFKRVTLSLQQVEERVDLLRRQKLLYIQQSSLPSPPATRLNF